MNLNLACCSENFSSVPAYLQHLKTHEDNSNIFIKCIVCGQTCLDWRAFRQHNMRTHKHDSPIELYDQYRNMVHNIISDDSNDLNEINLNQENYMDANSEEEHSFEHPVNSNDDFENTKLSYAQFLLKITYQNQLTTKIVDILNENTKKLVLLVLNDLKV
jgi:hypothetical protein